MGNIFNVQQGGIILDYIVLRHGARVFLMLHFRFFQTRVVTSVLLHLRFELLLQIKSRKAHRY